MMRRLRGSGPASLLVHALLCVCAVLTAVPLARSVSAGEVTDTPAVATLSTLIELGLHVDAAPLRYAALPALYVISLSPLLRAFWVRALLFPGSVSEHAYAAARRYGASTAVYAISLVTPVALIALPAWASLRSVSAAHSNAAYASALGPWLSISLTLLSLIALLHAQTSADAAQLELMRDPTLRLRSALARGVRAASFSACSVRAGCELSAWTLAAVALMARISDPEPALWRVAVTTQLCALAQTAVRTLWLAWFIERIEVPPRTGRL